MNTKVLLLGAVVTAFAFTSFAAEPLHSPRAKDSQIKIVNHPVATPAVTIAYVDSTVALQSPRAKANQTLIVQGADNDSNPALACRKTMSGSPKAVAACADNPAMPACNPVTVAQLK